VVLTSSSFFLADCAWTRVAGTQSAKPGQPQSPKRFECGGNCSCEMIWNGLNDAMRLQSKPFDHPTDNAAIPLRRSKRCSADEPALLRSLAANSEKLATLPNHGSGADGRKIHAASRLYHTAKGSLPKPSGTSNRPLRSSGPTSIGVSAFDSVLQQLAGLGVDTDFVCHATILDIERIA
jgi:hypothetical protein